MARRKFMNSLTADEKIAYDDQLAVLNAIVAHKPQKVRGIVRVALFFIQHGTVLKAQWMWAQQVRLMSLQAGMNYAALYWQFVGAVARAEATIWNGLGRGVAWIAGCTV